MSDLRAGAGHSTNEDTAQAVAEAVEAATKQLGGARPSVAIVSATIEHDAKTLAGALDRALPGVPRHAVSTSLGVLSGGGIVVGKSGSLGVMLLSSEHDGWGGVGAASFDREGGPEAAGRKAAERLLAASSGKRPSLLLLAASPGDEEAVMAGVASVLPDVPVFGGSAADNAIAGGWWVMTPEGPVQGGVSLAGLGGFALGGAIVAPYQPTDRKAAVSSIEGGGAEGRTVATLDQRSAMAVLDEWTGHRLGTEMAEGGNLLMQTALSPLGVALEAGAEGRFFQLLHPAHAHKGGAFDVFARVRKGASVCLMKGTEQGLVDTVDALVDRALAAAKLGPGEAKGAVFYYCAGCAGAVGSRLDEAIARAGRKLPGVPLVGFCTFGEQGHVPGLGSLHTNLSLVLVLLG